MLQRGHFLNRDDISNNWCLQNTFTYKIHLLTFYHFIFQTHHGADVMSLLPLYGQVNLSVNTIQWHARSWVLACHIHLAAYIDLAVAGKSHTVSVEKCVQKSYRYPKVLFLGTSLFNSAISVSKTLGILKDENAIPCQAVVSNGSEHQDLPAQLKSFLPGFPGWPIHPFISLSKLFMGKPEITLN